MLTSATKRKIDNARDILVGKIPMPTTQVEQITLALIYKFMSDIDKKSKALGDTSGFFANGYEKYAWDNLMDKSLPARDRVTLYSEGLEKMSKNPHIPQLFRDIFKNAFLPFRSPETLKLFLEQIGEFEYDHSEELGNAFEYLLSVMGSQGDAGQFRTPRHIIDFIVKVVDPSKTDTILDPACGTAGFLISAYKHIKEKGLTAEEQKKLTDNFVGYDISHDMQRLAMVNMYLHHFPDPKIFEYDTLSSEDRWDDDFDVILANPPFMTPTGGIRPHSKFPIQTSRAEALFTSYIMEHLTNSGKAGVIVPEGIIFKTDSAYKSLRKMMVEDNYLWAVVSLPSGVFNPYAGVKTSILFFDKEIARKTDKILFVKTESDGFDLGAQRREIKQNDLLVAKKLLLKFKKAILEEKELSIDDVIEMGGSTSDKKMMSAYGFDLDAKNHIELSQIIDKAYNEVKKEELKNNGYNLNGERYQVLIQKQSAFKTVSLSDTDLFTIESGGTPSTKNDEYWRGNVNWATLVDLPNSDIVSEIFATSRTITEVGVKNSSAKIMPIDSIIVSTRATIGRIAINKVPLATNQGFKNIIIKDKKRVLPKFVAYMLTSKREDMKKMATGGTFAELSKTNFSKLKIPLPPIQIQQEIVNELDHYKKIVDSANQIVKNYFPTFEINNNWKWEKLGNNIEFFSGVTISIPQNESNTGTPLISIADVTESGEILYEQVRKVDLNKKKYQALKKDDLLFNWRNGSTDLVGKTAIFDSDEEYAFASFLIGIRAGKKYLPKFLWYLLNQFRYQGRYRLLMREGVNGLFNREELKVLETPTPTLEEQREIIKHLDNEMRLAESNKEIMRIFQRKIEHKVNSIIGF